MAEEENVDVAAEVAEAEEPAAVEEAAEPEAAPEEPEAAPEEPEAAPEEPAAAEEEVEAEPAPAPAAKGAAGVFPKREGELSAKEASQMLKDFCEMLEKHYVDNGETVAECQMWFKLVVEKAKKKGTKFIVVDSGERGTDFKSIAGALDKNISLFCVCCRSWDEDNTKPRIVKNLFRWNPAGISVKMRQGYSKMQAFEMEMDCGPSIKELLDNLDDGWPTQQDTLGYLKTIKRNAGSHSRHNYCFGHEELFAC